MTQEVWKDIEWASNYLVSDTGKVKNRQTGRILKINKGRGKNSVTIRSNEGKYISRSVRNIQAEAFGGQIVPAGRPKDLRLKSWVVDEDGGLSEVDAKEIRGYRSYRIVGEDDAD